MCVGQPDAWVSGGDRHRSLSRRRFLAGLGGSGLVRTGTFAERTRGADASPAAPPDAGETTFGDPEALEAFVDDLMAQRIGDQTPGAIVAVVDGAETVLAKGYGTAAAGSETPVRGDATLFRLGSVSKIVTFTAVMQGVERGTLDLDADVNTYLADSAVDIPATYDDTVTLRHLGTHTGGFGWVPNPGFVEHRDEVTELETALVNDLPERRRPPGEAVAYSNYGAALAGHVVAEAHETTFAEYVRSEIFEPLGMDHSTFVQPVPADLPGDRAGPHVPDGNEFTVPEPVYITWKPAGSMSATATDVATFMRAHLADGAAAGARLLDAETARTMHAQQYDRHPAVNGWAYGFWEDGRPDDDVLAHTGATLYFLSDLVLFHEHDVGIFVSYNARGDATDEATVREVIRALVDEYDLGFDSGPATPPSDPAARQRADRVAGEYRTTWRPESELGEVVVRLGQATVEATGNGALRFDVLGREPARFVETGPYVYHEVDGHDVLAFDVEDGDVVRGYRSAEPQLSWEPVPLHERQRVAGGAIGLALGGFLLSAVGWGGRGGWRWWRRRRRAADAGATDPSSESEGENRGETGEGETEGSE